MCQETHHHHEEEHHHHGEHGHEGHHHHGGHHGMNGQSCCVDSDSCCSEPHIHRRFVSKEERIAKLEAYKQELNQELAGVEQEINKLRKA